MTSRRRVLTGAAAAAGLFAVSGSGAEAQSAAGAWAKKATEANEKELVIAGGTGAYVEQVKKHFYDPFTAATGIKVINAGGSYGEKLAKLKAMTSVGRVEWDLITLSIDALTPENGAMLRDLGTCAELPTVTANGIAGACLKHAVIFDIGGGALAYNRDAFPGAQPASWADFWDVKRFPGPRALPNIGNPWWAMIAALQADGVPADKLFPLDVERALKKLDQVKPHVAVWWRSGDQSQQIFRSKEVVMALMFSGRAQRLQGEGLPVAIAWNGALLDAGVWAVTKAAPRPHAAMALLEFIYTRPEAHAQFAVESFGSTAHKDGLDKMPEAARATQIVAPDNWKSVVRVDPAWLAGNQAAMLKRWAEWIAT
jgi:mannopine transport system substrate-binding protein